MSKSQTRRKSENRRPKAERNSKSEGRRPKEEQAPNTGAEMLRTETEAERPQFGFRSSGLGLLSDVGVRVSDFPRRPAWVEIDLLKLKRNFQLINQDKPAGLQILA